MRSLLVLVLTIAPAAGAAQATTDVPTFRLDDALAYARTHQPMIRSALAELKARAAEARIPRAQWYPQLGATAQLFAATTNQTTADYLGVRSVDLPRIGGTKATATTSWTPSVSSVVAIGLDQEVYDFGRIAAQAAVADAFIGITRANADAATLDVQLAVEEAYHGVLAAAEVSRATEDAYKRALAHREYAQASTHSGMKPAIELTRAQADVAMLEVRRLRASASFHAARAGLAAALGGSWIEVDAAPLAPAALTSPSLAEALRIASDHNPAIIAALARVQASDAAARAILHELLPNVFASLGLSGRAGGAVPSSGVGDAPYGGGWLPDVANWHAGLILQWTIFDMTVLARRSAALARREAAGADLEVARTSVVLAVERSFFVLQAAVQVVPSLEASVAAARANQNQAEVRFRAGLGNTLELADAEEILTQSELELAIGRFSVARARAALGRALGESQVKP